MELPLSSPAKCELRSVIRFLNAKNNSPVEIHRQLVEVYGEKCMDIKNVRKWCREFNEGRINVHDEQRHFVHKIVSETLGYRKVSARWVDKWLKEAAGEWYNTGITKNLQARMESGEKEHNYFIQGIQVHFPCKPYGSQMALMDRILKGLIHQKNCLLESPTGSGKSLALLCSCLAWQRNQSTLKFSEEQLIQTDVIDLTSNSPEDADLSLIHRDSTSTSPKNADLSLIDRDSTSSSPKNADLSSIHRDVKEPQASTSSSYMFTETQASQKRDIVSDYDNDMDEFHPAKKYRMSINSNTPKNIKTIKQTPDAEKDMFKISDFSKEILFDPEGKNIDSTNTSEKKRIPKIFFGTRTHKQITQIIRELKKTEYKDVKMCILSSREKTCIHPQVSRSSSKNEECQALLEQLKLGNYDGGCSYHHNAQRLTQGFVKSNLHLNDAWDLEDIVKVSKKIHACPYFGLRNLMQDAEIIFCPYNYIIDPIIRSNMEINLKGNIVVLDEAHNIEDTAREAASLSIKQDELIDALKDIERIITYEAPSKSYQLLASLLSNLSQIITKNSSEMKDYITFDQAGKVWSGEELVAILKDIKAGPENYTELKSCLMDVLSEEKEREVYKIKMKSKTTAILKNIFVIFHYLFKNDLLYMSDYRGVLIKTKAMKTVDHSSRGFANFGGVSYHHHWTYTLNFWCLNPGVAISDIKDIIHSFIVASGTLAPLTSFQSELGMPFEISLETNHVIKNSQVFVGTISSGLTGTTLNGSFKHSETFLFQDELAVLILHICQTVPYGVLCFLPSYKMMEKLVTRWKKVTLWNHLEDAKVIICEPRGSNQSKFESLLNEYYEANKVKKGALMFAVCRGKISEGLDFADNNARAVITVGIPFPNLKDIQVDLKKEYNNKYFKEKSIMPGNEWYETQAFRALNQALGRCIRHKNDWGVILLVDERFQKIKKYQSYLSKWLQNKVVHYRDCTVLMASLKKFLSEKAEIANLAETSQSQLVLDSKERESSPVLFD
ncbi:BRIP1 [Cordylochernes scorpioides]|uniref:BRIP1 n=1 Tax=Cordylochernes scorpioides TaxID=51811 RepID=A0ABY6LRX4_9ARAC|nr:BRIP1 [Cordylochernes scorpioides]